MHSEPMDPSSPCQRCKQRPATTTYHGRNGKWSAHVCIFCSDRFELQDTFEWGLLDTDELDEQERYDDILAWLDKLEETHRHRDHDGWLARSVAAHRAFIFLRADRYAEALEACEKREQLGFEDAWYRWSEGSTKAQALQGLGRHAEALIAFEEAFRHQDPEHMASARYFLRPLVEFSENAGKPVDESWRDVVHNVAEEFAVEVPERPTLAETILALFELTEGKPSRRQREWEKKQAEEGRP